ncbi:glycosyltransferase [Humidisolicoccus flavus]|uniref:glycosyltransferase n=1 Tax=Humidisolicoccus flavus TaxID=3111414 RepID=UPI003246E458
MSAEAHAITGEPEVKRVVVFPAWQDNPFINLTYLAAHSAGYHFTPIKTIKELESQLEGQLDSTILHMNWTSPIVQAAPRQGVARDNLAHFQELIDDARERGLTIVWTVHNVLPHDGKFIPEEIQLHEFLADRADVIHVMSAGTARLCAEFYELPEHKIMQLDHPSYDGVYSGVPDRNETREFFGLAPDDLAVLFLGHVKPYKGILELIEAVRIAADDPERSIVLMLAGKTPPNDLAIIDDILPAHVRAIRYHSYVPEQDLGRWLTAADLGVFPFQRILNSGSIQLAATYGLPVLIPDEPHLVQQYAAESWVRFFDRKRQAESIASNLQSDEKRDPESRFAARRYAVERSPYRLSERFVDEILRTTEQSRINAG